MYLFFKGCVSLREEKEMFYQLIHSPIPESTNKTMTRCIQKIKSSVDYLHLVKKDDRKTAAASTTSKIPVYKALRNLIFRRKLRAEHEELVNKRN